jgi:hypothetical protein
MIRRLLDRIAWWLGYERIQGDASEKWLRIEWIGPEGALASYDLSHSMRVRRGDSVEFTAIPHVSVRQDSTDVVRMTDYGMRLMTEHTNILRDDVKSIRVTLLEAGTE